MPFLTADSSSFNVTTKALNKLYRVIEKGQTNPLYFVCGKEEFLVDRISKKLATILLNMTESNMDHPTDELLREKAGFSLSVLKGEDASPYAITNALQTFGFAGLFNERRVIMICEPAFLDDKNKETQKEAIALVADTLQGPLPEGNIVIIAVARSLRKSHPLVKAAAEKGMVISIKELNEYEQAEYVRRSAPRLLLKLDNDATRELVERVGGPLRHLTNELKKLSAYAGNGGSITKRNVQEIIPSLSADIFEMIDAVAAGSTEKALQGLRFLLDRREPAQRILWMLGRQFRFYLQARTLIDEKHVQYLKSSKKGEYQSISLTNEVAERLPNEKKLNVYKQSGYSTRTSFEQAKQFDTQRTIEALNQILKTDVAIKRGLMDAELALELLILKLCQPQKALEKL